MFSDMVSNDWRERLGVGCTVMMGVCLWVFASVTWLVMFSDMVSNDWRETGVGCTVMMGVCLFQ